MKKYISKAKEMKLLSDIVWGWDLGKLSWTVSLREWILMLLLFNNNFITLRKNRINVEGDQVQSMIGYSFIVPVKIKNELELVDKERSCSHFKMFKKIGNKKFYYLSEVILHSEFRGTKEFYRMFNEILSYCVENNIDVLYTTAVSDFSRKIMKSKKMKGYAELLDIKENNREVYKIKISMYLNNN